MTNTPTLIYTVFAGDRPIARARTKKAAIARARKAYRATAHHTCVMIGTTIVWDLLD